MSAYPFTYDASGNIERQLRKDKAGAPIDSLTYRYEEGAYGRKRNRLYHVKDIVPDGDFDDDIDNMGPYTSSEPNSVSSNNNYRYDELGQLVYDAQEEIGAIDWRNDGKIRSIVRIGSSPDPDLVFDYDPSGNRLSKKVFDSTGQLLYTNYYLRDAQGNVMATYKHRIDTENETSMITVDERNIYGSDRLGMYTYADTVHPLPPASLSAVQTVPTGYRRYELKNHLGNVTGVITSHKVPLDANSDGTTDGYQAQVVSSYDYSPFGVTRLHYDGNTGETVEGNPLAADFRWCLDGVGTEANGSGNDAVLYAISNTTNRTAEANKALRSSGSSGSYMEIADNASFDFGSNDFTVSIWVRKDAAPTSTVNVIAVGKWNNTSQVATNEWCLNIASPSGTVRPAQFQIAIGSTLYTAQGTSTLSNTWHHLVGVREGSNIKFYLNGTLVATTAVGTGAINNVAGRDIRIGRSEGSLRTRAGFDEFLIYQRALSASEISDLYNATCEDLEATPGSGEIVEGGYRYGFNGMEKDDEVKGSGNSMNYKARIQDTRLGRFLSIDPLTMQFPHYSPYQFAGNKPIQAIDLDGKEEFIKTNFIDANGALYRTQIQVINHIGSSRESRNGLGPIQIIHNTDVVVDNFGNATVQYTGTTQGRLLQPSTSPLVGANAPGSSGFSLAENLSISNSTSRINTNGLIEDRIGVDASKKQIINTTWKIRSSPGVPVKLEKNGKDISTFPVNGNGLVEINNGIAPPLEPLLPDGFNVTPALGQRFTTPGANPIDPILLNNPTTILPLNLNLNAVSTQGTTQAQPVGTQEQVPQVGGGGESTITYR